MKWNSGPEDQSWRKDPNMLLTNSIKVWRGGTLLTAMCPRETARQRVAEGRALVISEQAIWLIDKKDDEEATSD